MCFLFNYSLQINQITVINWIYVHVAPQLVKRTSILVKINFGQLCASLTSGLHCLRMRTLVRKPFTPPSPRARPPKYCCFARVHIPFVLAAVFATCALQPLIKIPRFVQLALSRTVLFCKQLALFRQQSMMKYGGVCSTVGGQKQSNDSPFNTRVQTFIALIDFFFNFLAIHLISVIFIAITKTEHLYRSSTALRPENDCLLSRRPQLLSTTNGPILKFRTFHFSHASQKEQLHISWNFPNYLPVNIFVFPTSPKNLRAYSLFNPRNTSTKK